VGAERAMTTRDRVRFSTFVRVLVLVLIVTASSHAAAQPTPDAAPSPTSDAAPPDAASPDATPTTESPDPDRIEPSSLPQNQKKLSPAERDAIRKACAKQDAATCDQIALLGSLEREAVDQALAWRTLQYERAPWGKRVGKIHVVNHDVFGKRDGFLRVFNYFHFTSREYIVEREVILRPGETWDQGKLDESARKLRDPVFSVLATLIPVKSATPGEVDILVVTRDIWSLRLNTDYRIQGDKLSYLTFALSENNFLGMRKLLAAAYEMDLGSAGIGPIYLDPNVAGKRLDLYLRAYALFNRDDLTGDGTFTYEGTESLIRFNRPIWTLDSKWGWGAELNHRFAIDRSFVQTGLKTYDYEGTPEDDMIPWMYEQRRYALTVGGQRAFGKTVEHRIKAGHQLASQRPTVVDESNYPDEIRDAFIADVLPRSELTSALYSGYEIFVPDYREFRNINTFDVAEDYRLGPSAEATASLGLEAIGSDVNFFRFVTGGGWTLPLGADGMARVAASISVRRQMGDWIDNSAGGLLRGVSPTFARWFRIIAEGRINTLWNETQNRVLTLGGDNGLRGFGINQFEGQRTAVLQTEIRTAPISILFTRWGLVAFYDVGGAANSLRTMSLHHDVGGGIRVLIPQASAQLFRFDFSFPLDGPTAGSIRITAGFRSEF
jgi:hypothetical protein